MRTITSVLSTVLFLSVAGLSVFLTTFRVPLLVLLGLYLLLLLYGGFSAGLTTRRPAAILLVPFMLAGLHLSRAVGFLFPCPARLAPEDNP